MSQACLWIVDQIGELQPRFLVRGIDLQHGRKLAAGTGMLPGTCGLVTTFQERCDFLVMGNLAGILSRQRIIPLLAGRLTGSTFLP
jgi:hypothetical protein